ncbi:MAG: DUF354 domain-containing protein [Flavobacteriia bacterium]|nr:DUF354 domain-containing protein [Flavobacteriia bacterium]
MANILFHLGHPAHFHLFKNTISFLKENGENCIIAIKKKDVLEDIVKKKNWKYYNLLPNGKKKGIISLIITQIKQIWGIYLLCKKNKIDLLCGTSAAISIVGKILNIPSFNFNEDDAEAVPLYAKMSYPWANRIYSPDICSVGKWKDKKYSYSSYHELAYLHPAYFTPDENVLQEYGLSKKEKYFILRLASLSAHHDKNVNGLDKNTVKEMITILNSYGKVILLSEINLSDDIKMNTISINPEDVHSVLSFSTLLISDSQTMSAEAAVLGVPFIRCNDFVGKLSYLNELENKYQLGFGFKSNQQNESVECLKKLVLDENLRENFQKKRKLLLQDKIELSSLISKEIIEFIHEKNL